MAEIEGPKALPQLRVFRGGGPRRARSGRADVTGRLADRLSMLERQVEEALGTRDLPAGVLVGDLVRGLVDGSLTAYSSARREIGEGLNQLVSGGARRRRPWLADARLRELGEGLVHLLYRYWWRVEIFGLNRVPSEGRVLLVANRAPTLLPYEALVIAHALGSVHPTRRRAVPLVEPWLGSIPGLVPTLAQAAAPPRLARCLERDEAAIVTPEGEAALMKPYRDRYRIGSFGRAGFARVAIATGTPVVPVAVIGAAEVHPVVARLDGVGRALGLPTLPITPTFPWLGLAGLMPLPTKWTLHFGEPLEVSRAPAGPAAAARLREQVRERLQGLVLEGVRRRRSLFFG
jgi:1-acyl-sn-glycerol-3-phosphate acyltransferase